MVGNAGGLTEDKAGYESIVIRAAQVFVERGGLSADGNTPSKRAANTNRPDVRLVIDGYRLLELGDMALNIRIFPGDVIRVPVAGTIRISGCVLDPGEYPIRRNLTVLSTISLCDGLRRAAESTRTKLIRQLPNGKQVIVRLDLKAIAEGRSEDILMQDGDFIQVPTNGWKAFGYGFLSFFQGIFGIGVSGPAM